MNEDGTAKVDKNGRPIKVTKYTLKFPDTIIPVAENTATSAPEAPAAGSDFDKDAEMLNTPTL